MSAWSVQGAAWGDYDGDGFVDLLVTDNSTGAPWRNDGEGTLSAVPDTGMDVSGDAISWADYDGDGDLDIFVAEGVFSGGGLCRLYRNDGQGVFTQITSGHLVERSTSVAAIAWGDYDRDGFLDVFLPRFSSGQAVPSFLFHNNGDGTFSQVEQGPFTTDSGFSISCSWADYDNDGWLDLFVAERGGSRNRLYHNNGDGTFSRVLSGPIASDAGQCAGSS